MTPTGFLKIASLGLLAMNLSACSSSSWLKNIQVTSTTQNNDHIVQLSANLQTGGIQLGGISVPIRSKNGVEIGSVSLATPASGTGTQLALDFDLTTALGLQNIDHDATLPNGTAIPVANINAAQLMTFPVGSAGSKAYVLYDSAANQALIGLALVVNGINSGVTANLLLPFQIGSLSGSVGPFSGAAPGQSGLALFVNASSVLPVTAAPAPVAAAVPGATPASPDRTNIVHIMSARVIAQPMVFRVSASAKSADQKKIESHLADLSAKRSKLQAQ